MSSARNNDRVYNTFLWMYNTGEWQWRALQDSGTVTIWKKSSTWLGEILNITNKGLTVNLMKTVVLLNYLCLRKRLALKHITRVYKYFWEKVVCEQMFCVLPGTIYSCQKIFRMPCNKRTNILLLNLLMFWERFVTLLCLCEYGSQFLEWSLGHNNAISKILF